MRATVLFVALANIGLPARSGEAPSLQDLLKGTAPPAPLDSPPPLPLPIESTPPLTVTPPPEVEAAPPKKAEIREKAPLQGQVDASGKAIKKPLEATIQERRLNSSADEDDDDLKGMSPQMDKNKNLNANASNQDPLNGGLNSQDPDMDDSEVMVQWDKWHNRVLNAIQQGLIEQLQSTGDNVMYFDRRTGQMRSKYPLGTMAMFSCQVTPDHHIVNLRIDQPSGYPDYDRAVYQAVKVLEGSSILRYPKGSHRKIVFEAAGIRTSMQAGPANFHWGDTEHYRVPGGGGAY